MEPGADRREMNVQEMNNMPELSIEVCSVFGMPPVEFVKLAADLGCRHITTALTPFPWNPHNYPSYSLREDTALRRDLIAAMHEHGVSISVGEGLCVYADRDVRDYSSDLDIMSELGVKGINTVTLDDDLGRSFDQFGLLAEMVAARGMETTIELAPYLPVGTLEKALAAIRHVGRPDFRLLIDVMHFVRSGSGPEDILALDPVIIGYVQLSDTRIGAEYEYESYIAESLYERMVPGTGELGVPELLKVLPRDRVFGIEVPLLSEAKAGIGPRERLGKCVDAVRGLFEKLDEEATGPL